MSKRANGEGKGQQPRPPAEPDAWPPILLSSDERVALATLRLLIRGGVIRPADPPRSALGRRSGRDLWFSPAETLQRGLATPPSES